MSNRPAPTFADTLHVRDNCLCLAAQSAARMLARRFDDAFRHLGLTNGQFSLLMALNRPEPPSIGAVALVLAMDRTTLTAAIKPLEKRGLLETRTDPGDRRSRLLVLTAAGRATLAEALPIWKKEHALLDDLIGTHAVAATRKGLAELALTNADEIRTR